MERYTRPREHPQTRSRRILSLVLAIAAVGIPILAMLIGAVRGGERVLEAAEPGGRGPASTVASFHPALTILIAGAVLGAAGVWNRGRTVALFMGFALIASGAVFIFSVGVYFILSGLLLLAATAFTPAQEGAALPRVLRPPLALATLALIAAAVFLQASASVQGALVFHVVLVVLTGVTFLLVASGRAAPGAAAAAANVAWAVYGIDAHALGGLIPAGLSAASVAALWRGGQSRQPPQSSTSGPVG